MVWSGGTMDRRQFLRTTAVGGTAYFADPARVFAQPSKGAPGTVVETTAAIIAAR